MSVVATGKPVMIGTRIVEPNIASTCWAPSPIDRGQLRRSRGLTISPGVTTLPSPCLSQPTNPSVRRNRAPRESCVIRAPSRTGSRALRARSNTSDDDGARGRLRAARLSATPGRSVGCLRGGKILPVTRFAHDSPRPPRWWARGLLMAVVAVFLALFAWYAGQQLLGLFVMLVVAFFLALAFEPMVLWLVRRGVRRGLAAGLAMIATALAALGVLGLSGQLFVQQVIQLGRSLPGVYTRSQELLAERFGLTVPDADEVLLTAVERWGEELAGRALLVGSSILNGIFAVTTVLIVTYYLCAAGPRFRASICRWLAPRRQEEVLRVWEVAQVRVSDFITTRIVLAAIATVVMVVLLSVIGTRYALPLALFTGVVSQFVPTIGVYLGG